VEPTATDIKKAAHICIDEKFIDAAIVSFMNTPKLESHFFCFKDESSPFEHIKRTDQITRVSGAKKLITIINERFDVVFLHSLCFYPGMLLKLRKDIKIVWIIWGFDIYSEKRFFAKDYKRLLAIDQYGPATAALMRARKRSKSAALDKNERRLRLKKSRFPLLRLVLDSPVARDSGLADCAEFIRMKLEGIQYRRFVNRVDFIATVLPIEHDLIKKHNAGFKAEFFFFRYLVENTEFYDSNTAGKNVLIGNSCTETNNHIDVIEKLKAADVADRKWIIPLSYGNLGDYRRQLLEYFAREKLEAAVPLLDFMPFDDYLQVISSCQYAVFGYKRQQGMGNIYQMLLIGAKVFLYKDSIVYKHLKAQGYILFTIDDDLNHENLNEPLAEEQKKHNRALNLQSRNWSEHIKKLNASIDMLYSE
jgi:hypothetical protein